MLSNFKQIIGGFNFNQSFMEATVKTELTISFEEILEIDKEFIVEAIFYSDLSDFNTNKDVSISNGKMQAHFFLSPTGELALSEIDSDLKVAATSLTKLISNKIFQVVKLTKNKKGKIRSYVYDCLWNHFADSKIEIRRNHLFSPVFNEFLMINKPHYFDQLQCENVEIPYNQLEIIAGLQDVVATVNTCFPMLQKEWAEAKGVMSGELMMDEVSFVGLIKEYNTLFTMYKINQRNIKNANSSESEIGIS